MHAYKVRAAVRALNRHRFHDQWQLTTEDRMTFPILPTMMAVEELPKEMLDGNSAWLMLVKNAYKFYKYSSNTRHVQFRSIWDLGLSRCGSGFICDLPGFPDTSALRLPGH